MKTFCRIPCFSNDKKGHIKQDRPWQMYYMYRDVELNEPVTLCLNVNNITSKIS